MKNWLLGLALLLCSSLATAQMEKPRLQWFNAGISEGVSNIHFSFLPSLDLSVRGTTLRFLPLLPVMTIGITQSIYPMSTEKEVGFFVASLYYNRFNGNYKLGRSVVFDQDRFTFMGGLKMFFAKRIHAHLQIGASFLNTRPTENLRITQSGLNTDLKLAAELDLGINLWPHFTR